MNEDIDFVGGGPDYVGGGEFDDWSDEDVAEILDGDSVGAVSAALLRRPAAGRSLLTPGMAKQLLLAQRATAGKLPAIFLGFSQSVAASTSGQVASSTPNVKLRPTDLMVRSVNAYDFTATSIRVGRIDLIAGSTAIPMSAFHPTVVRPPISSPELDGGTPATITLNNLSQAASTFIAMYTALDLSQRPAC